MTQSLLIAPLHSWLLRTPLYRSGRVGRPVKFLFPTENTGPLIQFIFTLAKGSPTSALAILDTGILDLLLQTESITPQVALTVLSEHRWTLQVIYDHPVSRPWGYLEHNGMNVSVSQRLTKRRQLWRGIAKPLAERRVQIISRLDMTQNWRKDCLNNACVDLMEFSG